MKEKFSSENDSYNQSSGTLEKFPLNGMTR